MDNSTTSTRLPVSFKQGQAAKVRNLEKRLAAIERSGVASARGKTRKTVTDVTGDGTADVFTIGHGLGDINVIAVVRRLGGSNESQPVTVAYIDKDTITVTFVTAPALNVIHRIIVIG